MGRSWSNQSTMFLLSPCPSGKCSVEVPAWPHSAELVCCGDPSELSWLLLWPVLHGRLWCSVNPSWRSRSTMGQVPNHPEVHPGLFNTVGAMGRTWSNQSAMFSCRLVPRKSVLSRCRPGSQCRVGCCGDPSELSLLLPRPVVHGRLWCSVNPSWAYPQHHAWVKFPSIRKCTLGCSTRLEPWGGRGSNQSAMFLLSPCPSGKCSVEVPAWPHSAELVCCGDPSELSCLLLWHVLHGSLWHTHPSHGTCLTRSATSLQSPRPSEVCSVEVPAWPHSAEMGSCAHPSERQRLLGDPFGTEGCGSTRSLQWHIRSTEGQVPKHPEVHSGRFNAVEAKARPWLKQSATSLQSPRPSESVLC
ncbi:hypothetical protein Lal_00043452 [Lupinus albus]|nr:hypothetical protein Lal_00043452 [Lupinus albus]